jgi:hypothetical protein
VDECLLIGADVVRIEAEDGSKAQKRLLFANEKKPNHI